MQPEQSRRLPTFGLVNDFLTSLPEGSQVYPVQLDDKSAYEQCKKDEFSMVSECLILRNPDCKTFRAFATTGIVQGKANGPAQFSAQKAGLRNFLTRLGLSFFGYYDDMLTLLVGSNLDEQIKTVFENFLIRLHSFCGWQIKWENEENLRSPSTEHLVTFIGFLWNFLDFSSRLTQKRINKITDFLHKAISESFYSVHFMWQVLGLLNSVPTTNRVWQLNKQKIYQFCYDKVGLLPWLTDPWYAQAKVQKVFFIQKRTL